jgi:hypothetical protein
MAKEASQLIAVATARRVRDNRKAQLRIEADAWIATQLSRDNDALERAVMDALYNEHSITSVATAYTGPGKSPDRKLIHLIKNKHKNTESLWVEDYPFEWSARETETIDGFATVYDVVGVFESFGPEKITGSFTWRYDHISRELEPVLTDADPYPQTNKYYAAVLKRWASTHPYPEEDAE